MRGCVWVCITGRSTWCPSVGAEMAEELGGAVPGPLSGMQPPLGWGVAEEGHMGDGLVGNLPATSAAPLRHPHSPSRTPLRLRFRAGPPLLLGGLSAAKGPSGRGSRGRHAAGLREDQALGVGCPRRGWTLRALWVSIHRAHCPVSLRAAAPSGAGA